MKINRFIISIAISCLFFVFGLLTLPHYGINWDTINHLPRGQAYLQYFLTGKKDYSNLEPFKRYFQDPDKLTASSNSGSRSFYQNSETNFNYFMSYDGDGHPPLSDILSSFFNRILFGTLHLINDIDAYRVYGVLLAALTIGLVFYWVSSIYGSFTGFASSFILATYPLFWSESHFNTEKDIPETAFWTFFIFFVYKAITEKKLKLFLLAGIFFGLALGTKFNILFVFPIIGIWALLFFVKNKISFKEVSKVGVGFIILFVIGLLIFTFSWPYLWQDPITGYMKVFGFYKTIGTVSITSFNLYPIKWILYTTPPLVLLSFVFGVIYILKNIKKDRNLFSILVLIWLLVSILRVTLPGTTIYGGVRQIMEYIPALAIVSGIGIIYLTSFLKIKLLSFLSAKSRTFLFLVLSFAFLLYPLIKLHPNENTYFNFLTDGLNGAKGEDIHSWGNSFGSAYRQAVSWINKNAPQNSNVTLTYELLPNIPEIWFREDITYHNSLRSGYLMKGEYAITLTHQGTNKRSYYDTYVKTLFNPVFEVKSDGVSILMVWKNEEKYLRSPLEESEVLGVKLNKTEDRIRFDLGKTLKLSRLVSDYNDRNCSSIEFGQVRISENGVLWLDMPGIFPEDWRIPLIGEQPKYGKFVEPFAGQEARYIEIILKPKNTCLFNITNYKVFVFK